MDNQSLPRRVKLKDNKPASEAQRAYVARILDRMKYESERAYNQSRDKVESRIPRERREAKEAEQVRDFWALAEVAGDLSAWEASSMIDALKDKQPAQAVELALTAVRQRLQAAPLNPWYSLLSLGEAAIRWMIENTPI